MSESILCCLDWYHALYPEILENLQKRILSTYVQSATANNMVAYFAKILCVPKILCGLITISFFYVLVKGCPFPVVPKNGTRKGLSFLYNIIKFSCNKCYTLLGHGELKCLPNGTWSHSQPKCVCKSSITQAEIE